MLITVAALAVAVAIVALVGVRWWTWRPVVRKRVIVQTGDAAFNGVVLSRRGPLLELGDVSTWLTGGKSTRIDGTVVIERRRVEWIQVVG